VTTASDPLRLLTFGHGTSDRAVLTGLLGGVGAGLVVDVRRFPGSARNPDVHTDAMAEWLPAAGTGYRWEPRLGGRRTIPAGQDDGADSWWRVAAFRGYAAHMRTAEFRDAMTDLLGDLGDRRPTLVMCSESLWWRCHRRMIADAAVLLHGVTVEHLGHDGRLSPHRPSEGARVAEDGLRYDRDPAV
jgi:uncharacterized protein (DUF488 family)